MMYLIVRNGMLEPFSGSFEGKLRKANVFRIKKKKKKLV